MDMNIFDFLNEADVPEEVKAATKSKTKEKAKEKAQKKTDSKLKFKLPLKVYFQLFKELEVTSEIIGSQSDEITDVELTKYLVDNYPYVPSKLDYCVLDEHSVLCFFDKHYGSVTIDSETSLYYGTEKVDCQDIENDNVSLEKLAELLSGHLNMPKDCFDFAYEKDRKLLFTILKSTKNKLDKIKSIRILPYNEIIQLEAAEGTNENDSAHSDKEEPISDGIVDDSAFNPFDGLIDDNQPDEDDDENDKDKSSKVPTLDEIKAKVVAKYPFFAKHIGVVVSEDVAICFFAKYDSSTSSSPSKPKEEKFKVDGYTLSIVFERFELSAADFGGKTEVLKKDICKFLADHDYPEFEESRTNILKDDKKKLILAQIQGSRKGGFNYITKDEIFKKIENDEFFVCRYIDEMCGEVKVRRTPVGLFINSIDGVYGKFYFSLPKIPESILREISSLFRSRSDKDQNEMMCQIFYDRSTNNYFFTVPKQNTSKIDVRVSRDIELESNPNFILVMDIHSHNTMPAFFSNVDDNDEVETRLFAVAGGYGSEEHMASVLLRAGNGRLFVNLPISDVFEVWHEDLKEGTLNPLYEL